MNELQKRFTSGLDEVFEDSQSYVGVMSPEDHLFESVLSFTLDFFHAEITNMLDRLRLGSSGYSIDLEALAVKESPDIPITKKVDILYSIVHDLNNKIKWLKVSDGK